MRIVNLKVNNYKSLVNFETPNFGGVNLVHGLNNSGKSNFFEFLELLFKERKTIQPVTYEEQGEIKERRRPEEITEPYWSGSIYNKPYIFNKDNRNKPIEFEVSVRIGKDKFPEKDELLENNFLYKNQDDTPLDLIGEIRSLNEKDSQISLNKVKLGTKIIYETDKASEKIFDSVDEGSILKNNRDLFEEILSLLTDCTYLIKSDRKIDVESFEIDEAADLSKNFKKWLFNLYIDSENHSRFKELISFLNDFNIAGKSKERVDDNIDSFPFNDTDIGFTRFEDELEIMLSTKLGRFPLKNFGTGIKQIFYILTHIFDSSSEIILIEELELNLSPEYQEFLINNLNEFIQEHYVSQVFFSSHSDYLYRNDYETYEIKIDKEGKTSISNSDYNELKRLRRNIINNYMKDE